MTNYAYILNLFTEILKQSKAIKGRFYVGWRYGLQDINYDQLGQALDQFKGSDKYPLVMMAPPHSHDDPTPPGIGWETFRIILFFMKQSQVEEIDERNRTSQHMILEDWHDMKRCAVNFRRVLEEYQRTDTDGSIFRLPPNQALYIPISMIGADKVSGIRMDFDLRLFVGCDLEDYNSFVTNLTINLDGHAEHDL